MLLEPHRKPGQLREQARTLAAALGVDVDGLTDEQLDAAIRQREQEFRDNAPLTAAQAAEIILDGVRHERWRILVGQDAQVLDRLVRDNPEGAYEPEFMDKVRAETDWRLGRD